MIKTLLKSAVIFATLALTTNAFAAAEIIEDQNIGGARFKTSTAVILVAEGSDTAFTVSSKHTNGDTIYSANSADPTITATASAAGTPLTIDDIATPLADVGGAGDGS